MDRIDIKDFQAGKFIQQSGYKSFSPEKINKQWIISDPEINSLLSEANFKLGELNSTLKFFEKVDLFAKMFVIKESVSSCRIDGAQIRFDEILLKENDVKEDQKGAWREVNNYILSINKALENFPKVSISNPLIKEIHKNLIVDLDGKISGIGEFRKDQNWIGGDIIDSAKFIPPTFSEINELMRDLENFINNDEITVPKLIKIAIIHYQFETIHPFLDGNGRIGRTLINLFLVTNGFLLKPILNISDYFENTKVLYFENLANVQIKNDLSKWIKYFLIGIITSAEKGVTTFQNIQSLQNDVMESRIPTLGGKKLSLAKSVLTYLYKNPTIYSNYLVEAIEITKPTANAISKDFVKRQILVEVTGQKRNRLFIFKDYTKLFDKD